MEHRLLWFSKIRELFMKQSSILQKRKDANVLKEWRRDRRSFSKAMEKATKRNEDDIPFGFDLEDYATIFKQKPKSGDVGPRRKMKKKLSPPININTKITELLDSLNRLEIKIGDESTPRSKQNLLKTKIEKLLQFQNEIQSLQQYNEVAMIPQQN